MKKLGSKGLDSYSNVLKYALTKVLGLKWSVLVKKKKKKKRLFSCFSGPIGLFFFLLGRQIRKSKEEKKTITGNLS